MRKYRAKEKFVINDVVIANPGDELEIQNAVPAPGESEEDVTGYCDIHNLTTGEKYNAAWIDVDDSVEEI